MNRVETVTPATEDSILVPGYSRGNSVKILFDFQPLVQLNASVQQYSKFQQRFVDTTSFRFIAR